MNISIDESSGFCWGVVKTIDKIEEVLKESNNEEISVLGEIIHNPREIERLEKKGLRTITHKDMPDLVGKSGKVIIRAHGEPPQTYKTAEELGLEVIDATCPLVKTLQNRIRKAFLDGYQVIIFGKKNHAEIIGIRGVCNDECIVISGLDDALELVDFTKKSMFFSQTTMDWHKFKEIQLALEEKFNGLLQEDNKFITKNTVCKYVYDREGALQDFAKSNDVVLFVAGKSSSNGKILFSVCQKENSNTFFIEGTDDINYDWLKDAENVGITGATSTPQWYLQFVKEEIEKHNVN